MGTRGAQIFEVKNISNQSPTLLLEGHFEGEGKGFYYKFTYFFLSLH